MDAVSQLLAATWHDTYDAIYGGDKVAEINAERHDPATLRARLDDAGSAFLVAETQGMLSGLAFARREGDAVKLHQLYVAVDAQGNGIGAALFDAVLGRFADARRIVLEVEPQNTRAIAFYERAGVVPAGRTEACAGIDGISAIIMELALSG